MNYLGLKFPLPKPAAPVDRRELSLVVNSEPARVVVLPGSALSSEEFLFGPEDSYRVTLVDIDAFGNRSLPSKAISGSASDDMRPAVPGPVTDPAPADKRVIPEAQAITIKEQHAAKAAADLKAAETKAAADAKTEQDHQAALAKIDADAAKAKAAIPAKK